MKHHSLILITVDSLRSDFVGARPGGSLTPHLDAWSESGVRFMQAVANGPLTSASFPSILRSRYGSHGGAGAEWPSIARILASHGYHTGAFVAANPYVSQLAGYADGFQVFKDWMDDRGGAIAKTFKGIAGTGGWIRKRLGWRRLPALQFLNGLRGQRARPFPRGDDVVDAAVSWARSVKPPFFLWVHLMDLHYPYLAEHREDGVSKTMFAAALAATLLGLRRVAGSTMRRMYEQRVRDVDQMAARLIRTAGDDAVVVFTADHGEQFGERGRFAHPASLFDEQLRVPLILTGPGLQPNRVEGQFSLLDLCPTLLGLLGLPAAASFEGQDSSGALRDRETGRLSSTVISEAAHVGGGQVPDGLSAGAGGAHARIFWTYSARTPEWKLLIDEEGPRESLFDLSADPGERINVAGEHPAEAARLREVLESHRKADRPATPGRQQYLTPGEEQLMRKQLEDLGYL